MYCWKFQTYEYFVFQEGKDEVVWYPKEFWRIILKLPTVFTLLDFTI